MDTVSIDLGHLPALGRLRLVGVDWWGRDARFVVFRYAVDGRPAEFGIAMDLDKGALLDAVADDDADLVAEQRDLDRCGAALWAIALEARQMIGRAIRPGDVERTRRRAWAAAVEAALGPGEAASRAPSAG